MNQVFSKVFLWLFVGFTVTFGVAYLVSTNDTMLYNLFSGGKYIITWIIELALVIFFTARIRKMSLMTAIVCFLLYSGFTGLTLSLIFVIYEISSIMYIFGITAFIFLMFGLFGYVTKIDLTRISTYLMFAVIASFLGIFVNMFIGSAMVDMIICVVLMIAFTIFIAYDIQIIKRNLYGIEDENKLAVYGAFQLYLDFINLFIDLLRLFGDRKN